MAWCSGLSCRSPSRTNRVAARRPARSDGVTKPSALTSQIVSAKGWFRPVGLSHHVNGVPHDAVSSVSAMTETDARQSRDVTIPHVC